MVRPWKLDGGIFDVRLRIPADVRTVASNRQISLPKEAGGGRIKVGANLQHVKASLRTQTA